MEVDAKTNGLNGELKEFLTLFFLSASFSFPSPLVKATAKWERIAVGFSFVPFALALNALNVSITISLFLISLSMFMIKSFYLVL